MPVRFAYGPRDRLCVPEGRLMGSLPWEAWIALAALITVHVTVGAVMVRALDRINAAKTEADEAKQSADTNTAKVALLEKDLVDHRIAVARDYVSKDALRDVETRIRGAIRRLSDRLDKRFHQEGVA